MIRSLPVLLSLALLPLLPPPMAAETASLVHDVNSAGPENGRGGVRSVLYPLGSKALFGAYEPGSGTELWVTDGTPEGTELIADTCPGPCWVDRISFLGTVGGAAVFRTERTVYDAYYNEYTRRELWRSDGTSEGTHPLAPSYQIQGISCENEDPALFQGALYFAFHTDAHGCELWRTDGTTAGTRRVSDVFPGPSGGFPHKLFIFKGELHFFGNDAAGAGLWRSSGTGEGTTLVHRLPAPSAGHLFASTGARVFFSVHTVQGGADLWTSDGTAGGTRLLTDQTTDIYPLRVLDGILYFFATDADRGGELWRSDGTVQGTRPVTAFQNPEPFHDSAIEKAGGLLIFAASDGTPGQRLWTSGGTPETTRPLSGCPGGCPEILEEVVFQRQGARLLFNGSDSAHGTELWSTDGTGAGTRMVHDLCSGPCSSRPATLTPYLGALYFHAENGTRLDLWRTDGTAAGTWHVAALSPNYRFIGLVHAIAGKLFLVVWDSRGAQLWISDGAPEGTAMLTLIGRGGRGSNPAALAALQDQILFTACDGLETAAWSSGGTAATTLPLQGPSAPCDESVPPLRLQVAGNLGYVGEYVRENRAFRLWRTDGTGAGTFALPVEAQFLGMPAALGGRAIFGTGANGAQASLWETDGTAAGTRKLFDLDGVAALDSLTSLGPELYFTTNSMRTLWRTDGTAAGTRQLVTYEDTSRHEPFRFLQLTRAGSLAYFRSDLGRLYRTDGTAAGTYPVFSGSGLSLTANELVAFKGTLYFIGTSTDGRQSLWKTDGTPGGTVHVADVGRDSEPPYSTFFSPRAFPTVAGQQLFFVADDGEHGAELWRTDGTRGGSVLVRDIAPGNATSYASGLREAAGKLYFDANDGEHGFELWESDGTEAGTRMVQDIAPGASSSSPFWLTQAGDRLFFSADDGVTGREPWVLPLAGPASCDPSDQTLCLGGGRFRAEIQWRDFEGNSGRGHAVSLTPDTGYFWFFDAANVEVIVKVLDGNGLNGHHWVFYGALSSVEYTLTITDTRTGAARRYVNPPGRLGSVGDTEAFGPRGATGSSMSLGPAAEAWEPMAVRSRNAAALAPCVPSSNRLCLNQGRFAVAATWRDFQGNAGTAAAVPLTGDTGYFWFFDEKNVEVVLKVLDGRGLNAKFWVFYGALSSVEYTLTVTDTETGQTKTYRNPSGRLASVADTGAF